MKKYRTLYFALLISVVVHAQTWNQIGNGVNGVVNCLYTYDSVLYAGGGFDSAGNMRANFVAQWNGSAWSPLGSGMNYYVKAFAVYHGKLYAAGDFDMAGGNPIHDIAEWDGKNWLSVGGSVSGTITSNGGVINSLLVYNDRLIAGGEFDTIGGKVISNIAEWNDTTWSALGLVDGGLSSMSSYKNNLYVAGSFDSISHIKVNNIARWDGTTWYPVDTNSWGNGVFNCLYTHDSVLYAGGEFGDYGPSSINWLAQWNNTSWDSVVGGGPSVNMVVWSISSYDGFIYVGGQFTNAGGIPAQSIAKWDGKNWYPMGSGMNQNSFGVLAIAIYDSSIYAAGDFSIADGKPINHIAVWGKPTVINELFVNSNIKIYPNPSTGIFNFTITGIIEKSNIEIYDMLGENIHNIQFNACTTEVDLSGQPVGIYLYRIVSEKGNTITSGKLIVQ